MTAENDQREVQRVAVRPAARSHPLRSLAVMGAVGALVAAVALPAYTGSVAPASASTTTLQQIASEEAQSLVVDTKLQTSDLERGVFLATSQKEVDKIKAERAAAARKAYLTSVLAQSEYPLTSPGSGEVHYPLPRGSYYVSRTVGGGHQGADMVSNGNKPGIPIYASTSGTVRVSSENGPGWGVYVVIDTTIGGKKVSTLYAHMIHGSRKVKAGQKVTAGQLIGLVGSTGRSTANHLHFEVRVNGALAEPISWLKVNVG